MADPQAEGIREGIVTAYRSRDHQAFRALLADDVRWPEYDTVDQCVGPDAVMAWYQRIVDSGMGGEVIGSEVDGDRILLDLMVTRPGQTAQPHRQYFRVAEGRIVGIGDAQDHLA